MKKIAIINGPNLNLLGTRQTDLYGLVTLDEIIGDLKIRYSGYKIIDHQSNHEGQLIDWIQGYGFDVDGIVLNAGAYSHTSIALADAIAAVEAPVVEVHITDIRSRESFRHHSYLEAVCCHHIIGRGTEGYAEAVQYIIDKQ